MKVTFLACFIFLSASSFAIGTDTTGPNQPHRDSVVAALQTLLPAPKTTVIAVLQAVELCHNQTKLVVQNRTIPRNEKDQQIKALAKKRNDFIATLLTAQQIKNLKDFIPKRTR